MRIAITGSRGFLGRHIVEEAERRSYDVIPVHLSDVLRRPDEHHLYNVLAGLPDFDVMINCAASKKPRTALDHFVNAEMPQALANFTLSAHPNRRFIHISTTNVLFNDLTDPYTEDKRIAESKLIRGSVSIIRPGLIWSWSGEGDSSIIAKYLAMPLPVHFMLCPGNTYQPISSPQLASYICDELVNSSTEFSVTSVVGDKPLTLWDLTYAMAQQQKRNLLPVSTRFLRKALPEFFKRRLGGNAYLQQLSEFDRSLTDTSEADVARLPFRIIQNH